MTVTSIDIPDETWLKFRLKVMQNFRSGKVAKVIDKLIEAYLDDKIEVELEEHFIEAKPKIPKPKLISKQFEGMWVAAVYDKIMIATWTKEETEELAEEAEYRNANVFFVSKELVGKPIISVR